MIQLVAHYIIAKCYKMSTIDLSKQKVLGANTKVIQQINFHGNLDWDGNRLMTC